jgi:translation initiation factor 5A
MQDSSKEDFIGSYQAIGSVKKGDYVMIEDRPCQVRSITISKTGKHGSAKAIITGIDIFNSKKYITSGTTSDNIAVPKVIKEELLLVDISSDLTQLTVMDDLNHTSELNFLAEDELKGKIIQDFKREKELMLTVLKAIQIEKIIDSRANKD